MLGGGGALSMTGSSVVSGSGADNTGFDQFKALLSSASSTIMATEQPEKASETSN